METQNWGIWENWGGSGLMQALTLSLHSLLLVSQELRAHTDQSLGWTETTDTQHTKITRSQLLDLHPIPTHC